MIEGRVIATHAPDGTVILEPKVSIELSGRDRIFHREEVVVDTGFTGFLTLPESVIERLNLISYGQRPATLASGERQMFDIYGAVIRWHEGLRPAIVHSADGSPLIGMSLLDGSRLVVESWESGSVTIEEVVSEMRG